MKFYLIEHLVDKTIVLPSANTNSSNFLSLLDRATSRDASITLAIRGERSLTVIMKRFL